MLKQNTSSCNLDDYSQWLTQRQTAKIEQLAESLKGKIVYEINATAIGGGVVELLRSQVPLMRGLGIDARWLVLPPDKRFFNITKQLHNALQGGRDELPEDLDYFDVYTQKIATKLPRDGDLYILHDPQTLGLIPFLANKPVIWRCHIDLTNAEPHTFAWLRRRLRSTDHSIFSMLSYAAGIQNTSIVYPSIDPLQSKNSSMADASADKIIASLGIDPARPFVTQVSRYDVFKDPIGVLDMVRRTQAMMPGLQCVLLGNYADDDPEGEQVYKSVLAASEGMPDTHILVNVKDNERVVNALQSRAAAVIQYSSREGFGLTVTEAMWKSALVCARPVGGIILQVKNGKTGVGLTGKTDYDAQRLAHVIQDRQIAHRMGIAAHAHVEKNFITPVMLGSYLSIYAKIFKSFDGVS
jgi:trehalose synthase